MVTTDRLGRAGTRLRLRALGLQCSLVLGLLIALVSLPAASASAAGSASTGTQPAPTATASVSTVGAATRALLKAINADRTLRHVPALSLDKRQSTCSTRNSTHMAAVGDISHALFPSDICVRHVTAAENVGQGYGDALSGVMSLHRMMMNEGPCPNNPCTAGQYEAHGHFMNLMNKAFRHVGIGIVLKNGEVWLTENFTN